MSEDEVTPDPVEPGSQAEIGSPQASIPPTAAAPALAVTDQGAVSGAAKRRMPAWAWWLIGGASALLLILVIGGIFLAILFFGGGSKNVANDYVSSLSSGEVERANELARVDSDDKREAVLVSDAFAESTPGTDFKVERFQERDDQAMAEVSYKVDGSKLNDYIELSKDDDGWYVSRGLTYPLPGVHAAGVEEYHIPGFDGLVDNDINLMAYPGVYEILPPNKLFELAEPTTFEVSVETTLVEPEFRPTKEYLSAVDSQLKTHIDECLKGVKDIYVISECGLDGYPSKTYDIKSFDVKVSKYPGSGMSSQGAVEIDDPGEATLIVKGKQVSGNTGTEKVATDFSYLYFNVTVKGDKVNVEFY